MHVGIVDAPLFGERCLRAVQRRFSFSLFRLGKQTASEKLRWEKRNRSQKEEGELSPAEPFGEQANAWLWSWLLGFDAYD
jgi:hypothetical protein